MVVILLFLIQLKEEKIDVNNLIIMMYCLLCCTCTKSVTRADILIAFLYILFRQKDKRRIFILIFGVLVVFVLIGIYLLSTVRRYSFRIRLPKINFSNSRYMDIFTITAIGTICGYVVMFDGSSQMYFTLTVFPFATLLTGCWLESISLGNQFVGSCSIGIRNLLTSDIMERGITSHVPCNNKEENVYPMYVAITKEMKKFTDKYSKVIF